MAPATTSAAADARWDDEGPHGWSSDEWVSPSAGDATDEQSDDGDRPASDGRASNERRNESRHASKSRRDDDSDAGKSRFSSIVT